MLSSPGGGASLYYGQRWAGTVLHWDTICLWARGLGTLILLAGLERMMSQLGGLREKGWTMGGFMLNWKSFSALVK